MKKIKTVLYNHKRLIIVSLLGIYAFIGVTAFAQDDSYNVLSPLPGTTIGGCDSSSSGSFFDGCSTDLEHYLPGLFNLSIGVGAVAAFVVLTIYGLEYMLTDSLLQKGKARAMVENALWGLGLVIFAYAILFTINPNLLNGKLTLVTPGAVSGGGNNPTGATGGLNWANPCADSNSDLCKSETLNRSILRAGNVSVPQSYCNGSQQSGCTDVANLTSNALRGTTGLQSTCGCVVVTGATEHQAFNTVDMQANDKLNTFLTGSATISTPPSQPITKIINTDNGPLTVTFTYEVKNQQTGSVTSTGNHWHVSFP